MPNGKAVVIGYYLLDLRVQHNARVVVFGIFTQRFDNVARLVGLRKSASAALDLRFAPVFVEQSNGVIGRKF